MRKSYLIGLTILLVIGFAAVSANLVLNGTLKIGSNLDEFKKDVVFTRTNTQYGTATIENEGKSITFKTKVLKNLKQEAILEYDITNKSLQYDANITITCNMEDKYKDYEEYIELDNSIKPGNFTLTSGETKNGKLTITLKKTYVQEDNSITFKCEINANAVERTSKGEYIPKEIEYEEILLHGADPVLEGTEAMSIAATTNKKLIPVEISDEGEVTRADTTTRWYSYEDKKWANAVILVDGKEDPGANQIIKEEDIESYFVWIPKYRYKLWNVDTEHPTQTGPFTIEIEFGTENTKDDKSGECATPLNEKQTQAVSGGSGNCNNGEWMTHPAFITMGVNGFWVGKFEVGYKQSTDFTNISSWSKEGAEKDTGASTNVIVKPNVYSWRNINNKNMFDYLLNYATNLDSHMMKNTEWGAVAYLSHSEYGINNEVIQNTNSEYKTGYAKTTDSIVSYPDANSFIASTTGNITGIYDMSGGAWERLAAYRDIDNPTEQIGESGFTKEDIASIDEKYFDVYENESSQTSYEKRILGDATGEMGPFSIYSNSYIGSWYQDCAGFVISTSPWFGRGAAYNDSATGAGQFYFGRSYGGKAEKVGSRLVLAPQ